MNTMIYWKGECKVLELERANIIVVDHYDERGIPVFVNREVSNAIGMKNGRNSYWGVEFEEELSDGCNAVAYSFVLASVLMTKLKANALWSITQHGC